MHRTDDLPEALARLVALGQSPDVNIRPVLLRVTVDLFVNKSHHAPEDIHQFDAIVSVLFDDADLQTRTIVAEKLAWHPQTPRTLIDRFLADEPGVAAMAYAHADLEPKLLTAAATWGPAPLALAVACRPSLSDDLVEVLAGRPEDEVIHALVANPAVTLNRMTFQQLIRRARTDEILAARLIERPADPIDLAPLFPIARAEQRQAIIEAARRLELGKRQWGRLDGATADTLARLDRMVMSGERESFETALGLALGIDTASLNVLMHDEGGEIVALALAALGASPDMAARVFILGDPRIGRSVQRVRALTAIVATVSPHAARRLVAAMTASPAESRRSAQGPSRSFHTPRRIADPALETAPMRREGQPVLPTRRIG
jgi:uncharacterized protein (DUF2336 family)